MKNNKMRLLFDVALIVFLACAGYLAYRYLGYLDQKKKNEEIKNEVQTTEAKVDINDILSLDFTGERDGISTPIPEDVFTKDSDKKIDFTKLQAYNDELVAWIYVQGTQIDYPVARHEGEDQTFYLNYDMYKEPSYSGCIYMEDVNKADFSDNNTVIYGHNMKNGSMFKGLHKFEDEEFFNKNKYIYIYLPDRTLVYEIFAAYMTDDTHILSAFDFTDKKVYGKYLSNVTNPQYMGAHTRKDTEITTDDQIITLSTCVGGQPENRYLVQGVLKYDKQK